MSLADDLQSEFLSDGSLNWEGLGAGVIGGLFTAVWTGLIRLPLSIGEALDQFFGSIADGLSDGGSEITAAIRSSGNAVWDSVSFGFLSLPVSLAVILVTFTIIAWGWRYASS